MPNHGMRLARWRRQTWKSSHGPPARVALLGSQGRKDACAGSRARSVSSSNTPTSCSVSRHVTRTFPFRLSERVPAFLQVSEV